MAKLIASMSVSLDGFINDRHGSLDWGAPDEELHRFHNERVRRQGAQIMGRRLHETMLYWETAHEDPDANEVTLEFAGIWNALPKVVFSRTLDDVTGTNMRLATRDLAEEVAALQAEVGDGDIGVGGAGLAGACLAAGLLDEIELFVNPVVLGGGTPFFPPLDAPVQLELRDTRTFGGGREMLRYAAVR